MCPGLCHREAPSGLRARDVRLGRFVHIGDTQVKRISPSVPKFEFIFVLDLARELASHWEAVGVSGAAPSYFDPINRGSLPTPEVTPGIKSFW